MKEKGKQIFIFILFLIIICIGQFFTNATGVEKTVEENTQNSSSIVQEQYINEEITTESAKKYITNSDEVNSEEFAIKENDVMESNGETGLYYYLYRYQYNCQINYLKDSLTYFDIQMAAYEKMYQLGEMTEQSWKSCQTQKKLLQAQLEIAENEVSYYNLYLEKNEFDYSNYNLKKIKNVKSVDYYVDKYPEADYMTLSRYVIDYKNAMIEIDAKQTEIEDLKLEIKMKSLLLEKGEISQLELIERKSELAKEEYVLEQRYVEMNIAYYNLNKLCDESKK